MTKVNVARITPEERQGTFATCVVMKGAPGCGKSTKAKELKEQLESAGLRVGICSTDSIFMNAKGEYDFVPFAIGGAHAFLQNEMILSMRMREYDVYILDNTNLQKWEYLWLLREAMLEHMSVFVWDLRKGPNYGNIHDVPESKVKIDKFEDWVQLLKQYYHVDTILRANEKLWLCNEIKEIDYVETEN